jgi:hypothetical protein
VTPLHVRRTHPEYRPDCEACRIASVQVGGFPTQTTLTERQWDKDLPAYQRLRADGVQPRSTVGTAALERDATTPFEIASGRTYQDKRKLDEAIRIFTDGTGKSPLEPVTAPKQAAG